MFQIHALKEPTTINAEKCGIVTSLELSSWEQIDETD